MASGASPVSYGSDRAGLICGFVFSAEGVARPVDSEQAEAWLRGDDPPGFIWLHFNAANAATNKWLEGHFDLSDEFFEALREGVRSTRIEYAGLVAGAMVFMTTE